MNLQMLYFSPVKNTPLWLGATLIGSYDKRSSILNDTPGSTGTVTVMAYPNLSYLTPKLEINVRGGYQYMAMNGSNAPDGLKPRTGMQSYSSTGSCPGRWSSSPHSGGT